MDASNDARSCPPLRQRIRNPDLFRRALTAREYDTLQWVLGRPTDLARQRYERLAKAIESGDLSGADQILRSWGIR